jgi:hypothetical protein
LRKLREQLRISHNARPRGAAQHLLDIARATAEAAASPLNATSSTSTGVSGEADRVADRARSGEISPPWRGT